MILVRVTRKTIKKTKTSKTVQIIQEFENYKRFKPYVYEEGMSSLLNKRGVKTRHPEFYASWVISISCSNCRNSTNYPDKFLTSLVRNGVLYVPLCTSCRKAFKVFPYTSSDLESLIKKCIYNVNKTIKAEKYEHMIPGNYPNIVSVKVQK